MPKSCCIYSLGKKPQQVKTWGSSATRESREESTEQHWVTEQGVRASLVLSCQWPQPGEQLPWHSRAAWPAPWWGCAGDACCAFTPTPPASPCVLAIPASLPLAQCPSAGCVCSTRCGSQYPRRNSSKQPQRAQGGLGTADQG